MSVERIEKIVAGKAVQRVERNDDGHYVCHEFGKNVDPVTFSSLDDVAAYLRANRRAGVRMNPGWSKISRSLFIDGVPR